MFDKIKSKAFWQSVAERGIQTFWQTFLGSGVAITATTDISVVKAAAYSALVATVLSVLKSITIGLASDGNPSLGSTEVIAEPGATADPIGQETQQTVVPDPTGEIAQQVQEEVAAEDVDVDVDVAPAPLAPGTPRRALPEDH